MASNSKDWRSKIEEQRVADLEQRVTGLERLEASLDIRVTDLETERPRQGNWTYVPGEIPGTGGLVLVDRHGEGRDVLNAERAAGLDGTALELGEPQEQSRIVVEPREGGYPIETGERIEGLDPLWRKR